MLSTRKIRKQYYDIILLENKASNTSS